VGREQDERVGECRSPVEALGIWVVSMSRIRTAQRVWAACRMSVGRRTLVSRAAMKRAAA